MTSRRARIFIDFWNFQLSWNTATDNAKCNWDLLATTLVSASASLLGSVGLTGPLDLEETRLYASVDPATDRQMHQWLTSYVERLPSWSVSIRERRAQPRRIYCRHCGTTTNNCPACQEPYQTKPEKGVDVAIVTDMLSLAWQGAFDVAILVSSDADFVPAVTHVQERGLKVINAGWRAKGHELKKACWAAYDLDQHTSTLRRTPAAGKIRPNLAD